MGFRIGIGKKIGGVYVGASKNFGGRKKGKNNGGGGCFLSLLYLLVFPITLIVLFIKWAYTKTQEQKAIDPNNVWYMRTWGIILMLFLFFPVGIYLMFKYAKWNQNIKWIVTAAIGVIVIVSVIFNLISPKPEHPSTGNIASDLPAISSVTESNTSTNNTSFSNSMTSSDVISSKSEISSRVSASSNVNSKPPEKTSNVTVVPESSKPVQQPEETKIEVISVTSPIGRNETAALTVKGKPNTEYDISVFYSSGASEASGLENKTSDANGKVTWEWKIGGRTNPGTYRITVTGGGQTLETEFTVA